MSENTFNWKDCQNTCRNALRTKIAEALKKNGKFVTNDKLPEWCIRELSNANFAITETWFEGGIFGRTLIRTEVTV